MFVKRKVLPVKSLFGLQTRTPPLLPTHLPTLYRSVQFTSQIVKQRQKQQHKQRRESRKHREKIQKRKGNKQKGKMKEGRKGMERSVDDRYTQWKSLVPVLYDWLANHNLVWPSLSCRSSHAHKQTHSALSSIPLLWVLLVFKFCVFGC